LSRRGTRTVSLTRRGSVIVIFFSFVKGLRLKLLLHDQGILKRPLPVSVSDVFVIKSELEDWLEIGNKKNKFRTKKISKTKHLKSNEVRNIFSRAFKKLRENNNGEAPTYKEVWDAVFNENDLNENNLGGGLPLRPEYDENDWINTQKIFGNPRAFLFHMHERL